jgi:3-hydroxyisobutyrate dehydrogenase-like beta-hydroxyacid dehydrogenase
VNLKVTKSPFEVALGSDIVGISLPSESAANSVIFGQNGLLEGFKDSTDRTGIAPIIMEHGTVSRQFVLNVAKRASEAGVIYLDAPVSGGPAGAESGRCHNNIRSQPKEFR